MLEPQQTLTIQQALELAVQHHTAGRLSQAENIYQQILQSDPNQPVALHLTGVIAHQAGKNDERIFVSRAANSFLGSGVEHAGHRCELDWIYGYSRKSLCY